MSLSPRRQTLGVQRMATKPKRAPRVPRPKQQIAGQMTIDDVLAEMRSTDAGLPETIETTEKRST